MKKKLLVLITGIASVTGVIAQKQQVKVTLQTGEEVTVNVIENDPADAPNFYGGVFFFFHPNETYLEDNYGWGADIQYTVDKFRLHVKHSQGVKQGMNTYTEYKRWTSMLEGNAAFFFLDRTREKDKTFSAKVEYKKDTVTYHTFKYPVRDNRKLGLKAGVSWHNLPFRAHFGSNAWSEIYLTDVDSYMAFAGFLWTSSKFFEMDGAGRTFRKLSWYVDVFYPAVINMSFKDLSGTPVRDYQHNREPEKFGGRAGFEWISLLSKKTGLGFFYRLEGGYYPGYRSFGAGGFFNFDIGFNIGKRFQH